MKQLSQKQIDNIEALLAMNEDDLLADLGKKLSKGSMGASPPHPERNKRLGKAWLNDHRLKIASTICQDISVQTFLTSKTIERRVELVAVIADILATNFTGIPAFTVSVLVIKEGLYQLCGEGD